VVSTHALKVGIDTIFDKRNNKNRKISYNDIIIDEDGWTDADKYLPIDFDLVIVKTNKKTYFAWHAFSYWEGLKLPEMSKVLCWKRRDFTD
jgi:hypothetical protein